MMVPFEIRDARISVFVTIILGCVVADTMSSWQQKKDSCGEQESSRSCFCKCRLGFFVVSRFGGGSFYRRSVRALDHGVRTLVNRFATTFTDATFADTTFTDTTFNRAFDVRVASATDAIR
jgi:hypothetical protein